MPLEQIILRNVDYTPLHLVIVEDNGRHHTLSLMKGQQFIINVIETLHGYNFEAQQRLEGRSIPVSKLDLNAGDKADDLIFGSSGSIHYYERSTLFGRNWLASVDTGEFRSHITDDDGINKSGSAYLTQRPQDNGLVINVHSTESGNLSALLEAPTAPPEYEIAA
ncbi:hypothetical protein [Limoniibacter endophyticus]|uniref:Uncharacterized protein n=1 Tax=Limoniibacter endophyticus TaxID=1565040 RepID=A0A8J3GJM6_9HYPH|nr:hypothetical protein [Limoniibacter endophyticus]GHC79165.1 hypothetical protein GCM10010136_31500 [Limoniibacter endophyticus]